MPEAQTLLIVSEETSFGMPALICAWREGIWPCAGLEHLAHHDVLDLLGLDVGALERGLDRDAAELGRLQGGEAAAELADGRAGGCRGSRSWASGSSLGKNDSAAGPMPSVRRRHPTGAATRPRHRRRHGRRRHVRGRARSPTTSTAARCRRWSTPARRKPGLRKLAVTHAAGQRWILVGLGARDELRPRARARRGRRRSLGRARELGTRVAVLGAPAPRRRRRAGGFVEGTLLAAYRYRAYKTEPRRGRRPDELLVSAHHDVAAPVDARRASRPRPPTPRATCRTRPPTS